MENATERRKHITKQFESKNLSFSFFNAYTYQSINQSINQTPYYIILRNLKYLLKEKKVV